MRKWKQGVSWLLCVSIAVLGWRLNEPWLFGLALLWLALDWKLSRKVAHEPAQPTLGALSSLLPIYSRGDEVAETLLSEKISELRFEGKLSESDHRWLERLKEISELRGLLFGRRLSGKKGVRQGFAFAAVASRQSGNVPRISAESVTGQDIMGAATVVADLYWGLLEAAEGPFPDLARIARQLLQDILAKPYELASARAAVSRLTDLMLAEGGIPFLVLNFIRRGDWRSARELTQKFLTEDGVMDEELRSSLYWVSEIHWFTRENQEPITDYETSIRYLYHLCFTNPDRAGFLEIDSQFFSQFDTVNEIAREGFLFKESLIDKSLGLWKRYDGVFDTVFQGVLESMTQRKSKIYDERENWERFWTLERDTFSRDYLYVVEGNLFYASGHYDDAAVYYEKALKLNPSLRPALLNVVFCYARLKRHEQFARVVDRLERETHLYPSSLYVIGNSHLLLGNEAESDRYYAELKRVDGWERKAEYYRSTFCYENGLFEQALHYAKAAHKRSPGDSSITYHLSLCHNSVGEKDQALHVLKNVKTAINESNETRWLDFYRFTLERDSGRHDEASETLLRIPSEYFEDPDELEAALSFARQQKDLVLLRHLRSLPKD